MKVRLAIFVFLFVTGSLNAQIPVSINQADMPGTPDTLRVSIGTPLPAFNPALTGPNYTWNFAALTPASQWVENFVAVSSTPALYQFIFNMPFSPNQATIGYQEPAGAVPGGIGGGPGGTTPIITDYYSFFKASATDYRKVGFGVTMGGVPAPVTYDAHEIIYKFPLNYNNRDSASFSYKLNVPGTFYYGENGKRVNHADGWGTLTTPFGTFQTLRVVSKITSRDTLAMDTIAFPATNRPVVREYKWLAKNHKIPLLIITTTELAPGVQTVMSVVYRDIYRRTTIAPLASGMAGAASGVEIYPNPFSESIQVSFTKSGADPAAVYLKDALGRTVYSQTLAGNPGETIKTTINAADLNLPGGCYFIQVANGRSSAVQKLVRLNR